MAGFTVLPGRFFPDSLPHIYPQLAVSWPIVAVVILQVFSQPLQMDSLTATSGMLNPLKAVSFNRSFFNRIAAP